MPLWLIIFFPIGLVVVIGAVHLISAGQGGAMFESVDHARARLYWDAPTWSLTGGVLSVDRRAALFWCPDRRRVALACAHGDGFYTRFVGSRELRGFDLGDDGALVLQLTDFTSPTITLTLPGDAVPAWRAHLNAIAGR